jgi:hypothetical protein
MIVLYLEFICSNNWQSTIFWRIPKHSESKRMRTDTFGHYCFVLFSCVHNENWKSTTITFFILNIFNIFSIQITLTQTIMSTNMSDEKLICEVQKYSYLYDIGHKYYYCSVMFFEISETLNEEGKFFMINLHINYNISCLLRHYLYHSL